MTTPRPSEKLVVQVLDDLRALKTVRASYDAQCQDIARYFRPRSAGRWQVLDNTILSATPRRVLSVFTSILHDVLTPKGQTWHTLRPSDSYGDKAQDLNVIQGCETLNDALFNARYQGQSGFGSALLECYESLGAFGSMVLYTEEGYGDTPILYRCIPMSECYFVKNAFGQLETLYREFTMTAQQVVNRFGYDHVAQQVRDMVADPKRRQSPVTVVHGVYPKYYFTHGEKTAPKTTKQRVGDAIKSGGQGGEQSAHTVAGGVFGDFPYQAVYIDLTHKTVMHRGGYYEFPYHHADYSPSSNAPYSQGPASVALPDVKLLENQTRLVMRSAEKAIDPPMATVEKLSRRLRLDAGSVNPGLVNSQGQLLAQPMNLGGTVSVGIEMMEKTKTDVGRPFFADLFLVLSQRENRTAREVSQISAEKSMLLGPVTEDPERALAQMVKRELGILLRRWYRQGVFDTPTEQSQKFGGLLPDKQLGAEEFIAQMLAGIQVEYTSPMARLRKEAGGAGLMNMLALVEQMNQLGIAGGDRLDGDSIVQVMTQVYGMPAKILRPLQQA